MHAVVVSNAKSGRVSVCSINLCMNVHKAREEVGGDVQASQENVALQITIVYGALAYNAIMLAQLMFANLRAMESLTLESRSKAAIPKRRAEPQNPKAKSQATPSVKGKGKTAPQPAAAPDKRVKGKQAA